jgi:hypothetical protein
MALLEMQREALARRRAIELELGIADAPAPQTVRPAAAARVKRPKGVSR